MGGVFVQSLKFEQDLGVERGNGRENLPEQGNSRCKDREARVRERFALPLPPPLLTLRTPGEPLRLPAPWVPTCTLNPWGPPGMRVLTWLCLEIFRVPVEKSKPVSGRRMGVRTGVW